MFLPKFDALIARFPAERRAIENLVELLSSKRFREVTFDHLVARLNPDSIENLAFILAELTASGILDRVIRVESPRDKGGIQDYSSLKDIPTRIHDWRTDEDVDVTPDTLRVIYKLHA